MILYGGEGVGKTSIAAQFTRIGPVRFISIKETGLLDLIDAGIAPSNISHVVAKEWDDVEDATLSTQKGTLVLDSLSGLQELIFAEVCKTVYNDNWDEFTSYWKGQRVDSPVFLAKYQNSLDLLRERGVHVILLGHMITEETPNSMGANYLTHTLDLDKNMRASMLKWAQNVLFMNIDINITAAIDIAKDRTILTGKAKDEDKRVIWTEKSPGHVAKNRMNLPPVIRMGNSPEEAFKNLWKAMPESYRRTWPLPN